jgi:GMP synthase (glutamine-hydrolysing)
MPTPARRALVLSHLAFEDLGSLAVPLLRRGFQIDYVDVATSCYPIPQAASCELLVIMGGPIAAYDLDNYSFLRAEIALIGDRLAARKPVLGICLGAQLMAAALGARVYPGPHGAEIGWAPLLAVPNASSPTWFAPLLAPGLSVFHWHGDTFELPPGALHLAATGKYAHQAFALGDSALALQFHPEVTEMGLERWYVGHACELHHARIPPSNLRASAHEHAAALELAATRFFGLWLDSNSFNLLEEEPDKGKST